MMAVLCAACPAPSPEQSAEAAKAEQGASALTGTTSTSAFAQDHDWRFYRHAGKLSELEMFLGGPEVAKSLVPAPRAHAASKRALLVDGATLSYGPSTAPPPKTSGTALKAKLDACGYPALQPADVEVLAAKFGHTLTASVVQRYLDAAYVMREPSHDAYCLTTVRGDSVRAIAVAPLDVTMTTATVRVAATVPHTDCAGFVNLVATTPGCP